MSTTINENPTCVYEETIEALRSDRILTMLLEDTTERVARLLAEDVHEDDVRLSVEFERRPQSGWYITDWTVHEGQTPGDDVTSVRVQIVYRPGSADLAQGVLAVHKNFPSATDEHIAQTCTAAISAHVQEHAPALEILLDDVFLDVLSAYMGTTRDTFDLSFCVEAEFASQVITPRDVESVLRAEFSQIVNDLSNLGVIE